MHATKPPARVQALLLAARPDIQQLPGFGGLMLNSAAAQAKLTLIMRLELPLAGIANRLCPYAQLIPRAPHEKFCKDPSQVRACVGWFLCAAHYRRQGACLIRSAGRN